MLRLITRPLLWLFLLTVPRTWRDAVREDLIEEAASRPRALATFWACGQAVAIGIRLRWKRSSALTTSRAPWSFGADVGVAVRMFRRERGSSLAIVTVLAIGIAGITSAQAVFNYALFRPAPGVRDAGSLVTVHFQVNHSTPNRVASSLTRTRAMRQHAPAFTGLVGAGFGDLPFSSSVGGAPEARRMTWPTRDYFQVLGVRARLGRLPESDEYESPASTWAVISERLWTTEYDGSEGIVGHEVVVNGYRFPIIGVAAAYRGLEPLGQEDVWLSTGDSMPATKERDLDWPHAMKLVGRLRAGASIADAQAQVRAAWLSVGEVRSRDLVFGPEVFPGLTDGIGLTRQRLLDIYRVLIAGVGLLLVLACANAANLMVARNMRRARDLALRAAIGASRYRLIRGLIIEAGLIAIGAATAGLGLTIVVLQFFRNVRLLSYLPVLEGLSIDWRVALFSLGIAGATTMLFGVGPAVLASRANPLNALRGVNSTTIRSGRLRPALVCVQLALSLTLIAGTAVLAQSVHRLRSIDMGMDVNSVMMFTLQANRMGYDLPGRQRVIRETVERLRSAPGVDQAAATWWPPLSGGSTWTLHAVGRNVDIPTRTLSVSDDYFRTMGMRLIEGREFTPAESNAPHGLAGPAVLNVSAARGLFGTDHAVGREFTRTVFGKVVLQTVVGVVEDSRNGNLRDAPVPLLFEAIGFSPALASVVVRSNLPYRAALSLARDAVKAVDPALPLAEPQMVRDGVDQALSTELLLAKLGAIVAAAAGLLAVLGLYSVVTYLIVERTREFGVRLALGAPRRLIAMFVLRRVLMLSGIGIVFGTGLLAFSSRYIASRLYGVSAMDPTTLALSAASLVVTAFVAAWIPTRRASRIDPAITLRAE